jgi:hypothetical protein
VAEAAAAWEEGSPALVRRGPTMCGLVGDGRDRTLGHAWRWRGMGVGEMAQPWKGTEREGAQGGWDVITQTR